MQKDRKSISLLAIILAAVLVISAAAATAFVLHRRHSRSAPSTRTELADSAEYDTVEFGAYPQSRVTDAKLLQALGSLKAEWQSFGYFKGSVKDPETGTTDYMRYADVEYQGARYRAVTMDFYRDSMFMDEPSDDSDAAALLNHGGYRCGTVYWFRYEPLKWRVLDVETGMLLCERIIDSQPFNSTTVSRSTSRSAGSAEDDESRFYNDYTDETFAFLANDYAKSDIRNWLLQDFKATAFSDDEALKLQSQTLSGACYHSIAGISGFERMDGTPVQDAVTLLSVEDAVNPRYNFTPDLQSADSAREAMYSDYAVIQGLFLTENRPFGEWMLRTAGFTSGDVCIVGRQPQSGGSFPGMYRKYFHDDADELFSVVSPYASVTSEDIGIRPVIYCPAATAGKANPRTAVPIETQVSTTEPEPQEETEESATTDIEWEEPDEPEEFELVTVKRTTTTTRAAATTRRVTTTKRPTYRTTTRAAYRSTTRSTYRSAYRTTAPAPTTKGVYQLTLSGDKGVANVSGGGTYSAGTKVTVTATILFGKTFRQWRSSDSALLADGSAQTYTFTMPAGDVTLTAITYSKPTVSVSAGTGVSGVSGGGAYASGESVKVSAQMKPGFTFVGWVSETEGLSSKQNPFTFTMPEQSVKLVAVGTDKPAAAEKTTAAAEKTSAGTDKTSSAAEKTYTVTIKAGPGVASVTGSGTYKPGDKVAVSAAMLSGHTFDKWYGYTLANPASISTTFIMPEADVLLAAAAKDAV